MSSPIAFAVLRLITSWYLVGACTGRSAGFLASEDAIDVASSAAELVDQIRPVGDQAAGGDVVTFEVDCRQLVAGRKRGEENAGKRKKRPPSPSSPHSPGWAKPRPPR